MNINVEKSGSTFMIGYSLPQTCGGSRSMSFNKEDVSDTWYSISDDGNGLLTIEVDSNSGVNVQPRQGKVFTNLNGNQCLNSTIYINQAGTLLCDCEDIQITMYTIDASGMTSGNKIGYFTSQNDCFADIELTMYDASGETYGLSVGGNNIYLNDTIPQNRDNDLKVFDVDVQINGVSCGVVNVTQEGNEIKCTCEIIQRFIKTEKRTFPTSGGTYIIASGNTYGCNIVGVDVQASSSDTMYNEHNGVKAPWIEYNELDKSKFEIWANVSRGTNGDTTSIKLLMENNEGEEEKCGYNFEIKRGEFSNPSGRTYFGSGDELKLCETTSGTVYLNFRDSNSSDRSRNFRTWGEFYSPNEWIHFVGNVTTGNSSTQIKQNYTLDPNLTGAYRTGEIRCRVLIDMDSEGNYSEIYSHDSESAYTFTQGWCNATCCENLDMYIARYGNNQKIFSGNTYYISSDGSAMTFNYNDISRFDCDSVTNMRVANVTYQKTGVSINYSDTFDPISRSLTINILQSTEYEDVSFTLNCEIVFNNNECISPFNIRCVQSASPITSTSEAMVICQELVDSDDVHVCFDEECWEGGHRYWETTIAYRLSGLSMSVITCDANGNETTYPWLKTYSTHWPNSESNKVVFNGHYIYGEYSVSDWSYACGNDLEAYFKLKITNNNDQSDFITCSTLHRISVEKIVCDCAHLTSTAYTIEKSVNAKSSGDVISVNINSTNDLFMVSTNKSNGRIKFNTSSNHRHVVVIYDESGNTVGTCWGYDTSASSTSTKYRSYIYGSGSFNVPNVVGVYTLNCEYQMETYGGTICTGNGATITVTVNDPLDPTPNCSDWIPVYSELIYEIQPNDVQSGMTNLIIGTINRVPPTNFGISIEPQNDTYLYNSRLEGTNVVVDVHDSVIISNTNVTVNIYKLLNGSKCLNIYAHTITLLAPSEEGNGE